MSRPHLAELSVKDLALVSEVRGGGTHVIAERLAAKDSVAELADMLGAGGSSKSLAAGARDVQAGAAAWKRGTTR